MKDSTILVHTDNQALNHVNELPLHGVAFSETSMANQACFIYFNNKGH